MPLDIYLSYGGFGVHDFIILQFSKFCKMSSVNDSTCTQFIDHSSLITQCRATMGQIEQYKLRAMTSKRHLMEQTAFFRRCELTEQNATKLIKLYQDEVDSLSKRAKFLEKNFLKLFEQFSMFVDYLPTLGDHGLNAKPVGSSIISLKREAVVQSERERTLSQQCTLLEKELENVRSQSEVKMCDLKLEIKELLESKNHGVDGTKYRHQEKINSLGNVLFPNTELQDKDKELVEITNRHQNFLAQICSALNVPLSQNLHTYDSSLETKLIIKIEKMTKELSQIAELGNSKNEGKLTQEVVGNIEDFKQEIAKQKLAHARLEKALSDKTQKDHKADQPNEHCQILISKNDLLTSQLSEAKCRIEALSSENLCLRRGAFKSNFDLERQSAGGDVFIRGRNTSRGSLSENIARLLAALITTSPAIRSFVLFYLFTLHCLVLVVMHNRTR